MIQKIKRKLFAFFKHCLSRNKDVHIEQKIIASDSGKIHISIRIGKQ